MHVSNRGRKGRLKKEERGGMGFCILFDGTRSRHFTDRRGKFVVRLGCGKRYHRCENVGSFGYLRIGTVPKRLDWKPSSSG